MLIVVAVAGVELLHVVPCAADGASFYLLEVLQTIGGFDLFFQAERADLVVRTFRVVFRVSTRVREELGS